MQPRVATVYGQQYLELPIDLYIPPDALELMLESFEGPLDLLLYLIRKANVDVLDIPMAALTLQYLTYVEAMRTTNLELAAEYLLMAAMLIEIKSRMLLPKPVAVDEDETGDPRAELVRRLIEFEQMKLAALQIDKIPQAERDFCWSAVHKEDASAILLPSVQAEDLYRVWQGLLHRAKIYQHHRISREELSVREYMSIILRKIHNRSGSANDYLEFMSLFDQRVAMPVLVVHFLALLELARESLVEIAQTEAYAPIYIRSGHGTQ